MRKALLLALCVAAATGPVNAVQSGSMMHPAEVAGLAEPVEVLRDKWGINHIFARNEADLFFVQGYTAARDRLFQFELWRREAGGTGGEILRRQETKTRIRTRR